MICHNIHFKQLKIVKGFNPEVNKWLEHDRPGDHSHE